MNHRDPIFFAELKGLNHDLMEYLKKCMESSPHMNFTPTLEDYIKQFKEIDTKYPENTNNSTTTTAAPPSLASFSNTVFKPLTSIGSSSNTTTNTNNTTTFAATASLIPSFTATSTPAAQPPASDPKPLFSFGAQSLATSTTTTTNNATPSFSFGNFNSGATTAAAAATTLPSFGTFTGSNSLFSAPKFGTAAAPTSTTNNETNTSSTGDVNSQDGSDDDAPPPEPNVEQYDEPDSRFSVKCKMYEKDRTPDGEMELRLLGQGQLFIKNMDEPNKRQIIFRQEPDLKRVIFNEVLTPNHPIKPLPKAVQMIFPTASGKVKNYIAKLKDEATVNNLAEHLRF